MRAWEGERLVNPTRTFRNDHGLNRSAMQHRGPQLEVPQVCQVCFCMVHEGKLEDKGGRKEVNVRGYGGGGGGGDKVGTRANRK